MASAKDCSVGVEMLTAWLDDDDTGAFLARRLDPYLLDELGRNELIAGLLNVGQALLDYLDAEGHDPRQVLRTIALLRGLSDANPG